MVFARCTKNIVMKGFAFGGILMTIGIIAIIIMVATAVVKLIVGVIRL
jgi:hypothetical protein